MERFLNFCRLDGLDVEQKALAFFRLANSNSQDEVEDLVIRFIICQKERIDRAEITAGTLRNYVKAIKLFCKMNRINIGWDIIARSLPKVKQYANDRVPSVEEIRKLIEYLYLFLHAVFDKRIK